MYTDGMILPNGVHSSVMFMPPSGVSSSLCMNSIDLPIENDRDAWIIKLIRSKKGGIPKSLYLFFIPEKYLTDRDFAIEVLTKKPKFYPFFFVNVREDPSILSLLLATKEFKLLLQYGPSNYLTPKQMIECLDEDPYALEHFSQEWQLANEDACLQAILKGAELKFLTKEYKQKIEFFIASLKIYPENIKMFNEEQQRGIREQAVEINWRVIIYMIKKVQNKKTVLIAFTTAPDATAKKIVKDNVILNLREFCV